MRSPFSHRRRLFCGSKPPYPIFHYSLFIIHFFLVPSWTSTPITGTPKKYKALFGKPLPREPPKLILRFGEPLPREPPKLILRFGEPLPREPPKLASSFRGTPTHYLFILHYYLEFPRQALLRLSQLLPLPLPFSHPRVLRPRLELL